MTFARCPFVACLSADRPVDKCWKLIKKFMLRLFYIIFILSFFSCTKEGTGGKASVSGTVKHHANIIPGAVVYIKYSASEFPGNNVSSYDASVATSSDSKFEFKDLKKGDYYLFATGVDGGKNVEGGVPVKLKRTENKTIDVPVTEGH